MGLDGWNRAGADESQPGQARPRQRVPSRNLPAWRTIMFLAGAALIAECSSDTTRPPASSSETLVVTTEPPASAESGQPFSRQPVTQLEDTSGTLVTDPNIPITAAIASGVGALSGDTTELTDAAGQADFSNLGIMGSAGSYVLRFTAPGLPPVNSSPITLTIPSNAPTLVGAGDIADCLNPGDTGTAALLDNIPGTVFTAGDNAYENGTAAEYANCYDPTWGRQKARTRPTPGNHDYRSRTSYYAYFGANAGPTGLGYYSYDVGSWHIISLNSNVTDTVGSAQDRWLVADLAADTSRCTLAYFHFPLFTSGGHGTSPSVRPLWEDLYTAGADVIISGHAHVYERFAAQTPAGVADPARGIREFIVGTGGKSHGILNLKGLRANSEVFDNTTFGVLKLTLRPGGYDWQFVPVAGGTFSDSGSDSCH